MKDRAPIHAASAGQHIVESHSTGMHESRVEAEALRAPAAGKKSATTVTGLTFPRFFTEAGVDPFDEIEWEVRAAVIGNDRGEMVFEQRDVEIPKSWSQQATNIVVSKYFRGQLGSPDRERSVRQLIGRVVDTITDWARTQRYFATEDDLRACSDDLKNILVDKNAASHSQEVINFG